MVHNKFRLPVSAVLILAVLAFVSSVAAVRPATVDVQLLAVNDFHGALETTGSTGGVEYLATYVKNLEATNPNTFFVSGGDLIGASPLLSGLFHDEPTIEAFNLMGMDYAAVGNHEFDEGVAELMRMQYGGCHPVDGCQDGDPFNGADFQYLTANVIKTSNGNTLFSAGTVRNIDGTKLAFVGVSLQSTPGIVIPSGTAGLEFKDEALVINMAVAELKERGVRAIVVIVHDGTNACSNPSGNNLINATDPEVDVFIMGHSHSQYNCVVNNRIVTQAGSSGGYLTDIDLTISHTTGDVIAKKATNIRVIKSGVAKDPDMTALLAKYKAIADPIANRVIGSITADITRSGNSAGESALGDVIADAMLEETSPSGAGGAVISFMNPGGIRADLLYNQSSGGEAPGDVTYGEAFTVQPFSNNMVTMSMTGDQLKRLLESQYSGCTKLQVSKGFTYTIHSTAPVGSKISDIKINGVLVDPNAVYRVSTNNFLADGGDGCGIFKEGTERLAGMIDLDTLVAYFANNSPVPPGLRDRITLVP
jgi:5'-nucleotidase